MDNRSIASVLKEIALYKELNGENPFKVRAFENAARVIERYEEDIVVLAKEDRLSGIKGVGRQIENIIKEYIEKGSSAVLEELKTKFPESITDLLKIPGMGPKKVKAVWEKLGVSSIGELEYACLENRLASLEGFGEKSQQKILAGIDFIKRSENKRLISEAMAIGNEIVSTLNGSDSFARVTIAGSLRRGKTIFKDIDILLVPKQNAEGNGIRKIITSLADSGDMGIIGAGETKVSIRRHGLQVDFRIVEEKSFPSALQHFTGSREHNTILRARAKRMGFKMNEYGLFRGEEALNIEDEEDVYRKIGLPWIPPEIREGLEEVEAAERGELPVLVEKEDIKGMIHVHSTYSDGANSVRELAEACIDNGYRYLCISDHSKSAFYAGGLKEEELLEEKEEIDKLNRELQPFRIYFGIESDILPDGNLDYEDEVLASFDFVIASIHSKLSMGMEEATGRLIRAIENPFVTILGHPSGRLLLSREGYPLDMDAILEALLKNQVVLEHNCNPHRLDPDWEVLKKAGSMGVMVALSPDAHSIDGFDDMKYGTIMARKAWLGKSNLLNCMEADEIGEYFIRRREGKEN